MLRNAPRHKQQIGGARPCVLGIGGSSRLARMIRLCGGAAAQDVLWQGRAAGAGAGIDLLAEPLDVAALVRGASVADRQITTVLCLAGVIRGDAAALACNTDLALAALEAARDLGARRVILASSAAVYGAQAGLLDEDRAPAPLAPYGAAKAEMERAARDWQARHAPEIELCALRIGNVAGADALLALPAVAGAIPPEVTLDTFTDGHGPWRSYIGPQAFARAVLGAISAPALPPVLNLALPGAVSMDALLRAAERDFATRAAGAGAIARVEMDCSRAVALGLVPPAPARADQIVAELRAYAAQGEVAGKSVARKSVAEQSSGETASGGSSLLGRAQG